MGIRKNSLSERRSGWTMTDSGCSHWGDLLHRSHDMYMTSNAYSLDVSPKCVLPDSFLHGSTGCVLKTSPSSLSRIASSKRTVLTDVS